jgi:hypothetical protein
VSHYVKAPTAASSAHLAEGNPGEAPRQYRRYRRLLKDELAIEPSAAIRSLVEPLAS